MEKEDNTREAEEHYLPVLGVYIPVFTLYSPAADMPDTYEATQGLTLSPVSRSPKCPGSLPHFYLQLIYLDSSGFYFLVLASHPSIPSIRSHSPSIVQLIKIFSDNCRHCGRPGIYSQSLTSQMPHCCCGYRRAPPNAPPLLKLLLPPKCHLWDKNIVSELSGLLFDYQNSVKDPYTNESLRLSGIGKMGWLADKICLHPWACTTKYNALLCRPP